MNIYGIYASIEKSFLCKYMDVHIHIDKSSYRQVFN